MRKILFKAKCMDDDKRWVAGNLIHCTKYYGNDVDDYFILEVGEFDYDYYDEYKVIPETIRQYTGLTDKNGFMIWENDIVKTKYGRLCEVVWFSSPSYCGWDLRPLESKHKAPDQYDLWLHLEVVGNIFDNKAFLEK